MNMLAKPFLTTHRKFGWQGTVNPEAQRSKHTRADVKIDGECVDTCAKLGARDRMLRWQMSMLRYCK